MSKIYFAFDFTIFKVFFWFNKKVNHRITILKKNKFKENEHFQLFYIQHSERRQ
jgi:hypothetical protein